MIVPDKEDALIDTLGALRREMVDGPGSDSVKVLRDKDGTPRAFVIDAERYAQLVRPQTNGASLFSVGDVIPPLESTGEGTAAEDKGRS